MILILRMIKSTLIYIWTNKTILKSNEQLLASWFLAISLVFKLFTALRIFFNYVLQIYYINYILFYNIQRIICIQFYKL